MEEKKSKTSVEVNSAPFVISMADISKPKLPERVLHPGDLCPKCHAGKLDYDGLLNLACPACGYTIGGCFT
jgi:uncharacterized protein (DUF983 family)